MMMMMMNNPRATPEYAGSETLVWWDMDSCPLPNGYDPRRLGSRIDTELMSLGYNGPLSIVAVGNLDGIPYNFLEALSSTGVVIKHTGNGMFKYLIWSEALSQPPVTIMVITTNSTTLQSLSFFFGKKAGYNFLLAYPPKFEPKGPRPSPLISVGGEWHWGRDSLLKDSGSAMETRRQDKGSEMFSCGVCNQFNSLDDLMEYLRSSEQQEMFKVEKEGRWCKFERYAEKMEVKKKSKPYLDLVRAKKSSFEEFHNLVNATAKENKQLEAKIFEFEEEVESSLPNNVTANENK